MGATRDAGDDRATVDDLGLGREAYSRRAWAAVRDHLTRAEPATLTTDDWHALATAAYLVADRDVAVQAWQNARGGDGRVPDRVRPQQHR